jgi:hypothetical protein
MPPTRREFARRFRALDPAERAAFVADLLALQGWCVDREPITVDAPEWYDGLAGGRIGKPQS